MSISVYERDVAVPRRDGKITYVDIYRPKDATDIPIIVAYTAYGKRHYHGKGKAPGLHQDMGVPRGGRSKMAVFEGPDPSWWVRQGYAVCNVDAPGVGYSEGDQFLFSSQSGKEGYDLIEWLAQLPWCNGKIGMNGNSQLAMNQWYIASECPPHLAAIAPWEGVSDLYNDNMAQGGIPFPEFSQMINASYRGGWQTDDGEAIKMYPCWNEFWQDRVAKVENIKIPVYVTVGYQHSYHVRGSLRAWRFMKSKRKWLRMHRVFEWEDLNTPANMNDLKLFFDRYLKGIYNGWELTPAVRMDVMDGYNFDYQLARAENEFPLKRTQYTPFYLDASDMSMSREPVQTVAKASYEATEGSCHFDFPFEEDTELSGYMKLRLWVEADGSNDMDLMIWVMKADAEGNEVPTTAFYNDPVPGTQGFLRVSHRELDEKQSTEWSPVPSHRTEELLEPGQIVPVEIEIWPTCRMWHKGERLRVNIAGHYVRDESWFAPGPRSDRNAGQHIIHTGGEYDSYLLAPVIPPKYQVGDYKFPR